MGLRKNRGEERGKKKGTKRVEAKEFWIRQWGSGVPFYPYSLYYSCRYSGPVYIQVYTLSTCHGLLLVASIDIEFRYASRGIEMT